MEMAAEEKKTTDEVLVKKGGLRTMPFIIANEAFEKVAGIGLQANMIVYLQSEYNLSSASGATILFLWVAFSYATPIIGAFVSDSYLGRFRVIVLGSFANLLGLILLWLTAIIPGARPPHCDQENGNLHGCVSPDTAQMFFLLSAFAVMAIGAGGIRPCSLAFGADQLDNPDNPKNEKTLQSFFNWYYAVLGISVMISVIFVVAIQDSAGWVIGFGVPVGCMVLSVVFFLAGSSRYIKLKANESLLSSFAQVSAATWKNKHLSLPPDGSDKWYYHNGSKLVMPTNKLRFLNKTCVIRNPDDIDSDGLAVNPWNLCTVKQVEELKSLIKVLPIWSTGIMISVTLNQHAFPVLQAQTMDRTFIGKAKIPAGSFGIFSTLTLTLWVAVYDRILVPGIAKITKRPRGLTNIQRMGTGLLLSCIATAIAGAVEHQRRALALDEGLVDIPKGEVNMSAMWLVPQQCLTGIAEGLNPIGQIEFYYSQFPKSMTSIGVALFLLGMAFGNLAGSLIVGILSHATMNNDEKVSWISNNLNRGHYDYYYWLLSGLSVVNFFYYLICCRAYGNEDSRVADDGDAIEEDQTAQSEKVSGHMAAV